MTIEKGSSVLSVICLKIISSLLKAIFQNWYDLTLFKQNVLMFESLFESIFEYQS